MHFITSGVQGYFPNSPSASKAFWDLCLAKKQLHAEFAERFNFSSGALNKVIKRPFQVLPLGNSTNSCSKRKRKEALKCPELRLCTLQKLGALGNLKVEAAAGRGSWGPEDFQQNSFLFGCLPGSTLCGHISVLRIRLISKKDCDLI